MLAEFIKRTLTHDEYKNGRPASMDPRTGVQGIVPVRIKEIYKNLFTTRFRCMRAPSLADDNAPGHNNQPTIVTEIITYLGLAIRGRFLCDGPKMERRPHAAHIIISADPTEPDLCLTTPPGLMKIQLILHSQMRISDQNTYYARTL